MRLLSTKTQFIETVTRLKAKFQESMTPKGKTRTTKTFGTGSNSPTFTGPITKTINKTKSSTEQAEKGWISINSKKNSHNYHLNRMVTQSSSNLQVNFYFYFFSFLILFLECMDSEKISHERSRNSN